MKKEERNGELREETKSSRVVQNAPYVNPTPGKIPIVAYGFKGRSYPDLDDIIDVMEANCNMIECVLPISNNDSDIINTFKNLDAINKYLGDRKVYLMFMNWAFYPHLQNGEYPLTDNHKNEIKRLVKKYTDEVSLGVWKGTDEPGYESFNLLKSIGEIGDEIYATSKKHVFFNNFLPGKPASTYVKMPDGRYVEILTGISCSQTMSYLKKIQEDIKPSLWSYDYYPFRLHEEIHNFYYCLERYSKISKETNRPFWSYLMTIHHTLYRWDSLTNEKGEETESFPAPTVEQLCFEAFGALCYGAQGLVCFSFYSRPPEIDNVNHRITEFYEAPIMVTTDTNGKTVMKRTEVYDVLKNALAIVRKYDDIFLGASNEGVCYYGEVIPLFLQHYYDGFGSLNNIRIYNSSKFVMISSLSNGNYRYTVVMNCDYENDISVCCSFNRTVDNLQKPNSAPPISGNKNEKSGGDSGVIVPGYETGTSFTVDIPASRIAVFRWKV